jgi:pyruvate dehydrogenase E1 component alpha subunit/2-oxoisovalerate dehydrogenase E1 component alpha subunit
MAQSRTKRPARKPQRRAARAPSRAAAPAPRDRAPAPAPGLVRVLEDDGTARTDPGLPPSRLLFLYEQMVQVREFDRRMLMLQRQGRIGFYGPILGQEAATVGSVAALEDRDWIFPALREGAAAMMRGLSLTEAVNQLIGNAADRCKGRQMPCHYTFKEGHYYGMSSVIGTQISHAVGAAMAARIRGDDVVVLGYLGDGATSANDFHCGMNFAGVFQAPCVLFCQNNQWAISVPISKQSASETIAQKGKAYGVPSVRVDGNDVLAVHAVTREAVARARTGGGPTFVEAVTYRRLGHSSSDDPTRYRDEAEVREWERKDPVDRCRRHLERRGLWDEPREQALKERIAAAVNAAIAEAERHPPPPAETLITDVFAEVPPQLRDQLDAALATGRQRGDEGHFPL